MKEYLEALTQNQKLTYEQAKSLLHQMAAEEVNAAQVAALLTVFLMRPVEVQELQGFRNALLELCVPLDVEGRRSIDLCGTGGDGKDTFNISTLSALVVAGAGYAVTKHGNYSVSSACGSSDVMQYLGYDFTNDRDRLLQQLDQHNICFLHAPLFHPAMKNVAPIRKALGIKTFFNMLGPLVNPARPKAQFVGVYSLRLARLYRHLFEQGEVDFAIVHCLGGYDEVSSTDAFLEIRRQGEQIIDIEQLKLPVLKAESLFGGGDVAQSARIFTDVLVGRGTAAQKQVVQLNSARAMMAHDQQIDFETAYAKASDSLDSGAAYRGLKNICA